MIKKTNPKEIYDEAYTYKIVHKHKLKTANCCFRCNITNIAQQLMLDK